MLVFIPVDKLGVKRGTKFLPKEQIEMQLANDIGMKFPSCKFEFKREFWGNRITGIKIPAHKAAQLLEELGEQV